MFVDLSNTAGTAGFAARSHTSERKPVYFWDLVHERGMMSGCTFMAKSHKSAISPCSITTVPWRQNSQHPKEDQIFHTAMCRRDTDTFLESLVLMDERRSGFVIQVRANATGQGGAAKLRNYMCR